MRVSVTNWNNVVVQVKDHMLDHPSRRRHQSATAQRIYSKVSWLVVVMVDLVWRRPPKTIPASPACQHRCRIKVLQA
jgi:hypothetical protein